MSSPSRFRASGPRVLAEKDPKGADAQVQDQLLTKADAAKILGLTPDAVVFLEKKGDLPATRTRGGVRLFRASDVARLAETRELHRLEALGVARILSAPPDEHERDEGVGGPR